MIRIMLFIKAFTSVVVVQLLYIKKISYSRYTKVVWQIFGLCLLQKQAIKGSVTSKFVDSKVALLCIRMCVCVDGYTRVEI